MIFNIMRYCNDMNLDGGTYHIIYVPNDDTRFRRYLSWAIRGVVYSTFRSIFQPDGKLGEYLYKVMKRMEKKGYLKILISSRSSDLCKSGALRLLHDKIMKCDDQEEILAFCKKLGIIKNEGKFTDQPGLDRDCW